MKTTNIILKDGRFFIKSDAENISELNDMIRAVASELETINNGGRSEILDQPYVRFEIDDEFLQSNIFGERLWIKI